MPSLCFSIANPNKLAWVLWSYTPNLAHTLTSVLECNSSLVWSKTVQSSVHISRWRESVLACKLGCWNPRGSQPSLWKCSVHARDLEVWLNHQAPDSSPGRTNAVTTSPENSKWGVGGGESKKSLWTGTDCLQSLWQPRAGLFQVLAHPPSCSPTYLPSPSLFINLTYNSKVHQSHNLQVNPLKVAVEHLHFTYASLSCQHSSSTYKL